MRHPQHRRDLRFHEFPERSTSFPIERDVDDLLQLVLAGENAAAEIADASTAMEDFMVRSQSKCTLPGRRVPSARLHLVRLRIRMTLAFAPAWPRIVFLRCSKSSAFFRT